MKKHKKKLLEYLYIALMLFLPLSVFIDNTVLILTCLIVFFSGLINVSIKELLNYSLIPYFIYTIISGVIFNTFIQEISIYIKLLPLVLLPLSLSFYRNDRNIQLRGLFFLFIGICIIQIISIYGICNYYLFFEGKKRPLRSYSGINEILSFERPYLGYFSAIAMLLGYFVVKKISKLVFIVSVVISSIIIIVISARMGFLIMILSILIIAYNNIKSKKRKILYTIILCFGIITIFSLSNIPLKHRFIQIKNDSRMIVWEGALKVYKEAPSYFFGYSSETRVAQKLAHYYENEAYFDYEPDRVRFLMHKYNTHNQFLGELCHGGILGLILLVVPLFNCLNLSYKKGQLLETMLVMSIILFLFVENLLARQIGVYSMAIILSLTHFNNEKRII